MKKALIQAGVIFTAVGVFALSAGRAAPSPGRPGGFQPGKVYQADTRKTKAYIKDGLIVGGDRLVDDVVVLDMRYARNRGYERIVLDLEGNLEGDPSAIKRPPYYHVAVTPDMERMMVTVWGKPKLAFNSKKIKKSFRRSKIIRDVTLFPVLDEDRWTVAFHIRRGHGVEVFELTDPVRIIIDLKAK